LKPPTDKPFDSVRDKLLIDSLAALGRAGIMARQQAIRTGTHVVVVRDGKIVHVSAEKLRRSGFGGN
jgi:hypothetical protein